MDWQSYGVYFIIIPVMIGCTYWFFSGVNGLVKDQKLPELRLPIYDQSRDLWLYPDFWKAPGHYYPALKTKRTLEEADLAGIKYDIVPKEILNNYRVYSGGPTGNMPSYYFPDLKEYFKAIKLSNKIPSNETSKNENVTNENPLNEIMPNESSTNEVSFKQITDKSIDDGAILPTFYDIVLNNFPLTTLSIFFLAFISIFVFRLIARMRKEALQNNIK